MTLRNTFIIALNKQVELNTSLDRDVKDKQNCPEINLSKTVEGLISAVSGCFTAGTGIILPSVVIGAVVTKLGELAISIIRSGSIMGWFDFFTMLCSFLKLIIESLLSMGIANQFLANPALVQKLVLILVGKFGFMIDSGFFNLNQSVLESPKFNSFLMNLLSGGSNNVNNFCRTISAMTEEEAAAFVTVIMGESERIAAMLEAGRNLLSQGLASVDLRTALIMAMLAAIGITVATGGTATPITAPALALLIAGFILLGQTPPTTEELRTMGITI